MIVLDYLKCRSRFHILMSLFSECVKSLEDNTRILSDTDSERVFSIFENTFPITKWGRIDWRKIDEKIISDLNNILPYLHHHFTKEKLDKLPYILWDNSSLPAIEVSLEKILNVIDDVTAVSFDTWIFCPDVGYVIEFYHEGEITIGIIR